MVLKYFAPLTLLLPFKKRKSTHNKRGGDDSINDDDEEDGIPKYMLCLDRHLGLLESFHVLEGEREQGGGGDSDEEGG
jgi:hypothetical protein